MALRRRGPGVAGIKKRQAEKKAYNETGNKMQAEQLEHVREVVESFKTRLEDFAEKHRDKINRDPEFRHQFHTMCSRIGVDPLASSKGYWANLLGVGDFYYELGVIIIQVCLQSRAVNGGIMGLGELVERIRNSGVRSRRAISAEDVRRAVDKLDVLGGGFRLLESGGSTLVLSVPYELDQDQREILTVAHSTGDGHVTVALVQEQLGWSMQRVENVLAPQLQEGMVWMDDGAPDRKRRFYYQAIFVDSRGAQSA